MAISKNPFMSGVSGTIGKEMVFRQLNQKTVISAYPDMSERVLSEKQILMNKLIVEADKYAQDIRKDDAKRAAAQVRLNVPSNKLYTSLISEFYELWRNNSKK